MLHLSLLRSVIRAQVVLGQKSMGPRARTCEEGLLSIVEQQALAHWRERQANDRTIGQVQRVLGGDEWAERPRDRS